MSGQADRHPESGVIDAFDAATRAIAGLQSVDDALQVIVDQVRPLVGARYAALGTFDADGAVERFITSGITAEERARIGPIPRGHGLIGVIVRENRAIRIDDLAVDPRRYGFPPHHPEMHTLLGVPVTVQGRTVGDLYLTERRDGKPFTHDDQRLVETFAVHAGIAIENARLHEQVQRLAVVDERERISNDLHDGIIQSLYAVGLSLEDMPELAHEDPDEAERRVERAIESLHQTIRDIRNFIFGLRPELLGGTTLADGLRAIVAEFRHNSIIDVELDIPATAPEPDPPTTAHLLGMVNETLSNVARHSGASMATVVVEGDDQGLGVIVTDNGTGFDASGPGALGHQGLANMRSRAATIGATMALTSGPTGTRVEIRRPGRSSIEEERTAR